MLVNVYAPTLLLRRLRVCPVASLRAVTTALGTTAPVESVMVPDMEDVSDCASARVPATTRGPAGRSAANRKALLAARKGNIREASGLRVLVTGAVPFFNSKIWERYHRSPF